MPFAKISSWALLVIISFIIVADLKHLKASLAASRVKGETGPGERPVAEAGE